MGHRLFANSVISTSVNGTNTVVVNGKVVSGTGVQGNSHAGEEHLISEGCGNFESIDVALPCANKISVRVDDRVFGAEAKVRDVSKEDIVMEVSDGVLSVHESDISQGGAASLELRIPEQTYEAISVSTSSGDIVLAGIGCVKLSLESMSGDITVLSSEFVDISIETMSGDVEVRASNVEICAVDCDSMSGNVSVNRSAPAISGGRALRGKVSTMSGDIHIN